MSTARVMVESQLLEPDGRLSVRLAAPPGPPLRPGQMFAGFRPGHDWHCHTLVPTRLSETGFTAPLPDTALWPPGSSLELRGPMGVGFSPPEASRRWLLVSFGGADRYLRPLVELGLVQGREMAYATDHPTDRLPPAVEVLSTAEQGLAWADYIAVGLPLDRLDDVQARLDTDAWQPRSLTHDEALVVGSAPCGMGGCQGCTFQGLGRRHLPCVDGPILRLGDIRR